MKGVILSAPTSGGGKTTLTLALLRALRNQGIAMRSAKSGPDYIDPKFHEAASGAPCVNLDAWAMSPKRLQGLAAGQTPLIIEGAMGLFDGAADGTGSTADLAKALSLPVILILDASKQAQSVAPLVSGFTQFDANVPIAGVILNKVGSDRHERLLRRALEPIGIPVLASVRRDPALALPSRHLGLVQASEHVDLETFMDHAAEALDEAMDWDTFWSLLNPIPAKPTSAKLQPPAQRIAIARDMAFAFSYPHMLQGWNDAGAELSFFSPLADEAPCVDADLVYLPGGYPELYAGSLANNTAFLEGVRQARSVYGECGGYMVMGDGLIDADGTRHEMLGLLRLETNFAKRKLHLGYRTLSPLAGPWATSLKAHEFHYASILKQNGKNLFNACDAEGAKLDPMGLQNGAYFGSFAHIIDHV